MNRESNFICSRCEASATSADRFCKECGAPFSENLSCARHKSTPASGVCVICSKPFCKKCGGDEKSTFFCNPHSGYEFHEGMARVFGSIDNVQSQYATTRLEQAGLHPFLYSRRFNPGSGIINTWIRAGIRNYGRHPIVELKLLVPFCEVLKAEKTLKKLGIGGSPATELG